MYTHVGLSLKYEFLVRIFFTLSKKRVKPLLAPVLPDVLKKNFCRYPLQFLCMLVKLFEHITHMS